MLSDVTLSDVTLPYVHALLPSNLKRELLECVLGLSPPESESPMSRRAAELVQTMYSKSGVSGEGTW